MPSVFCCGRARCGAMRAAGRRAMRAAMRRATSAGRCGTWLATFGVEVLRGAARLGSQPSVWSPLAKNRLVPEIVSAGLLYCTVYSKAALWEVRSLANFYGALIRKVNTPRDGIVSPCNWMFSHYACTFTTHPVRSLANFYWALIRKFPTVPLGVV